jgi:hypothetical protein
MKIAYTNKRLLINFLLGIVWTGIGLNYYFEDGNHSVWRAYLPIALGVIYLLMSSYEYFRKYIEITNEKIIVHSVIRRKEIEINKLTQAGYYAGYYTFKTSDKVLKIAKSQISPKDLPKFDSFFNELHSKLNKENLIIH